MKRGFGVSSLLVAAIGLMLGTGSRAAIAATFDQQEVNQDRMIVIAAPAGESSHQLLILEQLSNSRSCWSESGSAPVIVEPLLLEFDFTGICSRSTDSNGYSVRVGNQDLSWEYSLRIENRGNDLVLVAFSNVDRDAPILEVGRTNGITSDFAKIELSSGWRLAKRSYDGQVLSHVYLAHDSDLATLNATASTVATTAPGDRSTTVTPPTQPTDTATRPTLPTASTDDRLPRVVVPTNSTMTDPVNSNRTTDPTNNSNASGRVNYRVVVDAPTLTQQNQVRELVPDAFRTTIANETVMQVGLFDDRRRADDLQERLSDENLQARILLTVPTNNTSTSSSRLPTTPPRTSQTSSSSISVSEIVVAIDPGHGGRDPGAVGIDGLREKDVVLDISQEVADRLEDEGITVVMTRSSDLEVDLDPRVERAEQVDADLFVSIHANALSLSRPDVNGVETFYSSSSSSGRQLAQAIQTNLVAETDMTDRGIKTARFYVLVNTSMPSVLVEVGFVTGEDDAARLSSDSFRDRIAGAIVDGILQYLGN